MPTRATSAPQKQPTIWALIADGKQARVYECRRAEKIVPMSGTTRHAYGTEETEWELVPRKDMSLEAESIKDYQIGHGRRGTASSGMSPARNTYEPHGDIKEELKRHFVTTIAAKLQQACLQKSFDRLIMAAPPHMLGELREYLDPEVRKTIMAELPHELAHCGTRELLAHIRPALADAYGQAA
ncbi:MAG TPA: host attachment protein [Alphaproteobacteria bacterium]|nr:host attachment protein [Alphaproteobacteria bacterium]